MYLISALMISANMPRVYWNVDTQQWGSREDASLLFLRSALFMASAMQVSSKHINADHILLEEVM